jgi:hypothetical protein
MTVNSSSSSGKYSVKFGNATLPTSFAHYLLQDLARRVAIDKLVKAVQDSDLTATTQKKFQDENDNSYDRFEAATRGHYGNEWRLEPANQVFLDAPKQ